MKRRQFKTTSIAKSASGARRIAAKRATETRRLYRFEDVDAHYSAYAVRARSLHFLRRLGRRIWARAVVDFGPGTLHAGQRVSFCDWARGRRIELAPGQRTLVVFLHEMTHALGRGTHGKRFVKKYFRLLADYGKCNEEKLVINAALFGIKA